MCTAHNDCHAYSYDASLCYEAGSFGLLRANPDLSNGRLVYVDSVVDIVVSSEVDSIVDVVPAVTTESSVLIFHIENGHGTVPNYAPQILQINGQFPFFYSFPQLEQGRHDQ